MPTSSSQPAIIPALLRPALAHAAATAGFDKTSASALASLSDAFSHYLATLALSAMHVAALAGRGRPTSKDVAKAIDDRGVGWPGGGMVRLRNWFESEQKTRTKEEEASYDGAGLPKDEWVTAFLTGGRLRISEDSVTYTYAECELSSDEESESETEIDEFTNGDQFMEIDPAPEQFCEKQAGKTPLSRTSVGLNGETKFHHHIPPYLPPFPSSPVSVKGKNKLSGKSSSQPAIATAAELINPDKTDHPDIGAEATNGTFFPGGDITSGNVTLAADQASQSIPAPINPIIPTPQPTATRDIFETYTTSVPFAASRLKDHPTILSTTFALPPNNQNNSPSETASTPPPPSFSTEPPQSFQKSRAIRAIEELEKALAGVPAPTQATSDPCFGSNLESDICVSGQHLTDTLFAPSSTVGLLDQVVSQLSPQVVKLITPTPLTIATVPHTPSRFVKQHKEVG